MEVQKFILTGFEVAAPLKNGCEIQRRIPDAGKKKLQDACGFRLGMLP